jgi:hypothetical protein
MDRERLSCSMGFAHVERRYETVTAFMLISADFKRTQSKTIRTRLVSALFTQFDSFFGAFRLNEFAMLIYVYNK